MSINEADVYTDAPQPKLGVSPKLMESLQSDRPRKLRSMALRPKSSSPNPKLRKLSKHHIKPSLIVSAVTDGFLSDSTLFLY